MADLLYVRDEEAGNVRSRLPAWQDRGDCPDDYGLCGDGSVPDYFCAFLVASWVSGSQVTVVVSAVLLVLMIVVTMMVIMYYASYLGTIKVCRLNATTGESYGNVSGYLAVMSILLALFSVINLLSAIVNVEISGLVSSVGNIGWLALLAVWIFRYRGDMSEYEE